MAFSQPSQKFYTPYTDIYESRMLRFYGFTLLEFGVFPLIAKICYLFFLNEMKLKILFCVIQSLNSHWNISMLFPYNRGCVLLNLSAYCARFFFIILVVFLTNWYEYLTDYKSSEINLIHVYWHYCLYWSGNFYLKTECVASLWRPRITKPWRLFCKIFPLQCYYLSIGVDVASTHCTSAAS